MFAADIVQQAPHRLVLEDELVLFGVEWQCKDASFKLYDMLYYASNGRIPANRVDEDELLAPLAQLDFGLWPVIRLISVRYWTCHGGPWIEAWARLGSMRRSLHLSFYYSF